jgi:predicted enzyme related to lactoylglutathione lyase
MHEAALTRWRRRDCYGLMLVSVRVADVDAARRRCHALGIAIAREVDFGSGRLLVVADPDGTEIGIFGPSLPAPVPA